MPTNMAHSRPARITQPSAKLSSENAGAHQLSAHQHANANARKAHIEDEPSAKASHNIVSSTDSDGGNTSDHAKLGCTSDDTITNRKKCPIVVSDNNENHDTSPISTQQSDNAHPKKKKKCKKCTSMGM
jgi:hypothetical protein